jgi:hypothetical protein
METKKSQRPELDRRVRVLGIAIAVPAYIGDHRHVDGRFKDGGNFDADRWYLME